MAKYKLTLELSDGNTIDASGYIEIPDSSSGGGDVTAAGDNNFTGNNTFSVEDLKSVIVKQDENNRTELTGRIIKIFDNILGSSKNEVYQTSYRGDGILLKVSDSSGTNKRTTLLRIPVKEGKNTFTLATTDDIAEAIANSITSVLDTEV